MVLLLFYKIGKDRQSLENRSEEGENSVLFSGLALIILFQKNPNHLV